MSIDWFIFIFLLTVKERIQVDMFYRCWQYMHQNQLIVQKHQIKFALPPEHLSKLSPLHFRRVNSLNVAIGLNQAEIQNETPAENRYRAIFS